MARKKSIKKDSGDFYSEGVNFSDDPDDSFYATSNSSPKSKHKRKKSAITSIGLKKELYWGFQLGELVVLFIEALLLIYLVLVLLGQMPLF